VTGIVGLIGVALAIAGLLVYLALQGDDERNVAPRRREDQRVSKARVL
jgi:hypothetical protein